LVTVVTVGSLSLYIKEEMPKDKSYDKSYDKTAERGGTPWNVFHFMCRIAFMPACKPCHHKNRPRIDAQMIDGTPYRIILTENPDLSLGSLSRHRAHIKQALASAMSLRAVERAENGSELLQRVLRLAGEAEGILEDAKSSKNLKAATSAICAAVRVLELVGRLSGELQAPNAGGLHLTLNRVTNTTIHNYGDDAELAQLVGEATKGFSVDELMRLRAIAESESSAIIQP
jgi:hypothetical protein